MKNVKRFIAVIIFSITALFSYGQKSIKIPSFTFINDSSLDYNIYISEKPVTNLDYLTYLCWLNYVFSDYPGVLANAFPSLDYNSLSPSELEGLDNFKTQFKKLMTLSNLKSPNYLFDHKHLNYPVLGLSLKQIQDFARWLTDRYNEYNAIKQGILEWDPNQKGFENFSTESYLNGQYEGLVRRNIKDKTTKQFRLIIWSDNYFIPNFRLPTNYEVSIVNSRIEYKEYESFVFIKPWTKLYIEAKEGLTIKFGGRSDVLFENYQPEYSTLPSIPDILKEYYFSCSATNNQKSLKAIYQCLGQQIVDKSMVTKAEKDSLGHFPFLIIGSQNQTPIYATPPKESGFQPSTGFRLVVNVMK
ncbi:MAG: hypothetical protein HC905_02880 [Bacteroidales bacterium]|nr:hypothetical protein [Bacteroidales bacterium]